MLDKIAAIRTFLIDLDQLPAVYRSSQVKFGLVLYPDGAGQLPWVHQTYADITAFRASLAKRRHERLRLAGTEPGLGRVRPVRVAADRGVAGDAPLPDALR